MGSEDRREHDKCDMHWGERALLSVVECQRPVLSHWHPCLSCSVLLCSVDKTDSQPGHGCCPALLGILEFSDAWDSKDLLKKKEKKSLTVSVLNCSLPAVLFNNVTFGIVEDRLCNAIRKTAAQLCSEQSGSLKQGPQSHHSAFVVAVWEAVHL